MADSEHLRRVLAGQVVPNANLSWADLAGENLAGADLSGADLSGACLGGAYLRGANLAGANLRKANLARANLRVAHLANTDLRGASLRDANLTGANLQGAKLEGANLRGANLRGAHLVNTNLSGANLREVNLEMANLSGAKGLLDPATWLAKNCESDEEGIICYKVLPSTQFPAPAYWPEIKPGAVLMETVNPDRGTLCGCGVNVVTWGWIEKNHLSGLPWRCRIAWRDLAGVIVPFGTDGEFRAGRVTLLEKVAK